MEHDRLKRIKFAEDLSELDREVHADLPSSVVSCFLKVQLPGMKWVEGHKGVFHVAVRAVSSIHTQVNSFLTNICLPFFPVRNVWFSCKSQSVSILRDPGVGEGDSFIDEIGIGKSLQDGGKRPWAFTII